jgi:hypothetical protein
MMLDYDRALVFVSVVALGRVVGIVALKFRQARYSGQAVAVPRTWRDVCTVPEPGFSLLTNFPPSPPLPSWATARSPLGWPSRLSC